MPTCNICGKFLGNNGALGYHLKAHKNEIIVKCDWCEKNKKISKYELNAYEHHFCSRDCKNKFHSKFMKEKSKEIRGKTFEEIHGKEKAEKIKEKISIKAKERMKDPQRRERLSKKLKGRVPWSKGLTKENHTGLEKMSKNMKGKWKNVEYKEKVGINISKGKGFDFKKIEQIIIDKKGILIKKNNEYKNSKNKIKIQCKKCNNIWNSSGYKIKIGYWCPYCKKKTEQKCREIFERLFGVKFLTKRPDWLEGLELDGYNKELGIAFEYNGRQHYEFVEHWHKNIEGLKEQQERDKLKKELCKKKGIILIVIPYYKKENLEKNIQKILNGE